MLARSRWPLTDLLVIAPTSGHRPYHGGAVFTPTMVAPNGPIGYRPRHYHGAWTWHFQTPGLQCRAIWGSLGIPGLCLADRCLADR